MTDLKKYDSEYKNWLIEIKNQFRAIQIKAAIAVNSYLISFYWDLGKQIADKEENAAWGSGFIDKLSKDLKEEFPGVGGFSSQNLRYCRAFYKFYTSTSIRQQVVGELGSSKELKGQLIGSPGQLHVNQLENSPQPGDEIAQQPVAKIPWGHNILIFSKIKKHTRGNILYSANHRKRLEQRCFGLTDQNPIIGKAGQSHKQF
ncbi:hypothetical protein BH10BAC3_BH10BAC3_07900 [soil metagenome]